MEQAMEINAAARESSWRRSFSIDTTFVLFFLSLEFGRTFALGQADVVLVALAMLTLPILIAVPYFLPTSEDRPEFKNWVFGRTLIAGLAFALGMIYGWSEGMVFSEMFRFLPMTLLLLSAFISSYIQFCGIMRFRLAR